MTKVYITHRGLIIPKFHIQFLELSDVALEFDRTGKTYCVTKHQFSSKVGKVCSLGELHRQTLGIYGAQPSVFSCSKSRELIGPYSCPGCFGSGMLSVSGNIQGCERCQNSGLGIEIEIIRKEELTQLEQYLESLR